MSKKEELERLDTLVRKHMIEALSENGDISTIPAINTVVQYLAKNNVAEEKASSSIEEINQEKIRKANERRRAKEGK